MTWTVTSLMTDSCPESLRHHGEMKRDTSPPLHMSVSYISVINEAELVLLSQIMYYVSRFWPRKVVKHLLSECLSVCLSVRPSHSWLTPKQFKISKCFCSVQQSDVSSFSAPNFVVLYLGFSKKCVKQTHPLSTVNVWPILCNILETARDTM